MRLSVVHIIYSCHALRAAPSKSAWTRRCPNFMVSPSPRNRFQAKGGKHAGELFGNPHFRRFSLRGRALQFPPRIWKMNRSRRLAHRNLPILASLKWRIPLKPEIGTGAPSPPWRNWEQPPSRAKWVENLGNESYANPPNEIFFRAPLRTRKRPGIGPPAFPSFSWGDVSLLALRGKSGKPTNPGLTGGLRIGFVYFQSGLIQPRGLNGSWTMTAPALERQTSRGSWANPTPRRAILALPLA